MFYYLLFSCPLFAGLVCIINKSQRQNKSFTVSPIVARKNDFCRIFKKIIRPVKIIRENWRRPSEICKYSHVSGLPSEKLVPKIFCCQRHSWHENAYGFMEQTDEGMAKKCTIHPPGKTVDKHRIEFCGCFTLVVSGMRGCSASVVAWQLNSLCSNFASVYAQEVQIRVGLNEVACMLKLG